MIVHMIGSAPLNNVLIPIWKRFLCNLMELYQAGLAVFGLAFCSIAVFQTGSAWLTIRIGGAADRAPDHGHLDPWNMPFQLLFKEQKVYIFTTSRASCCAGVYIFPDFQWP